MPGPPKDMLGNELHEGDFVVLHPLRPVILVIMKIQNGGLHTNQGTTPALLTLGYTATMGVVPESNVEVLVRVTNPQNQKLVDDLMNGISRRQ